VYKEKSPGMKSLSEFIIEKREKAGLSLSGLADKANIKKEILEDIESGKELFLSVTQRQQLSRVLKISPKELKEYERSYEFQVIPDEVIENLKSQILNHKTDLHCPMCGEPLITRIAKMYDLDDNLVLQPKAHCVKCVFQIKD
jgi:transcriptional regulator with XRE-family HTH domain